MHDLVAAGLEGMSKAAIEREWSLFDVEAQQRAWRRSGPPLNIAATAIAAALGVKLTGDRTAGAGDAEARRVEIAAGQPTLADLAGSIAMPIPGGDTVAASHAILAKLKELTADG